MTEDTTIEQMGIEARDLLDRCKMTAGLGLAISASLMAYHDAGITDLPDLAEPLLNRLLEIIQADEARLQVLRSEYQARKGELADLEGLWSA